MDTQSDLTTVDELAELFDVTPKCVRDWIAEGLPVQQPGERGRNRKKTLISLRAAVRWYLENKEYDDQRQRLAAAQAERVEAENAVRRGDLARREDVVRFWSDCCSAARARFLALPTRLATLVPQDSRAQLKARARELVHEALREFAAYEPKAARRK